MPPIWTSEESPSGMGLPSHPQNTNNSYSASILKGLKHLVHSPDKWHPFLPFCSLLSLFYCCLLFFLVLFYFSTIVFKFSRNCKPARVARHWVAYKINYYSHDMPLVLFSGMEPKSLDRAAERWGLARGDELGDWRKTKIRQPRRRSAGSGHPNWESEQGAGKQAGKQNLSVEGQKGREREGITEERCLLSKRKSKSRFVMCSS